MTLITDTSDDSSPQPLVSVIIPAYAAEKYIERTLDSVLRQTYRNIEVIVVDDGSTDRTFEILQRFAKQDSRVRLFQQRKLGVSAARNLALSHATGEFIAPIDADDIWSPANLKRQVECLQSADDSTGVSYAWSRHIDEFDQVRDSRHAYMIEGDVYATLLCHYFLGNASCTVIRKRCLDEVGYYSNEFRFGCEDWELYLRLADAYKFKAVPEFLVCYRKTAHTLSQDYRAMEIAHSTLLATAERRGPVPGMVRRLSRSSLCLYLAHQSTVFGTRAETLEWILFALKSDWISPFFRADFYMLALVSLLPETRRPTMRTAPNRLSGNATKSGARQCRFERLNVLPRMVAGSMLHAALRVLLPKHRLTGARRSRQSQPLLAVSPKQ